MKTYKVGQEVKIGKYSGKVVIDTGLMVKVELNNGVTQMTKKENIK